ncbi:MAG: DUF1294 domain-containing protein [Oscillospiraceae bacterium]|nr:DUF1294 domain-containing protein [Oscillospiraceae bacterium]
MNIIKAALIYYIIISAVSAVITVYDKIAAKKFPKKRVPEKTLMLLGFFGGAAAMYSVMLLIRHKTKHNKFMIGLPVFIVLQIIIVFLLFRVCYN